MDKENLNKKQPNNPLHGVKLLEILEFLVEELGWATYVNFVIL